ncbi:cytochrome P450 [Lizonia empirigonia]|nr:cytochrome P450 [Lizonia empirigonia]
MELTPANVALAALPESVIAFYLFPNLIAKSTLTSFFFAFLVLNFVLYGVHKLILYPFLLSPLRHLPQAGGFKPLIGHGIIMFQRPPGQAHLNIMKATPNDGIIRTLGFFHTDRLILTSPAALADVLVNKSYDFEKPPWSRAFLRKFLGDGLLMTEGDEHKHHRKHIMPAFHFRHIKELYPVFWSKSVEFCNVVKASLAEDASKILEIGHYSTQVTLDIIGLAGLGRDIASLRSSEDELVKNYEEILEPTSEKAIYFVCHLIFPPRLIAMLPWKLNERVKITTGNLKRICTDFVVDRKSKMKHESQESRDILSIMIRSNNFSDENLVDQLLTFMAAGHETTSSALTWASHLLSKHPDIQNRLRSEIQQYIPNPQVLSDPNFDVAGLLEGMPYLNGVCNEVLRLYPTIPVTARLSIRDTTIAGVFIPKGTMMFVAPWAINRNPQLWGDDAEDFVPTRWIDKATGRATMNGGADSNYAFLTFLHGPRSCIGERFARAELRALLAAFVGNFEMEMADPNEVVIAGGTITSKPVNGMKLKLKPVKWEA